MASALSSAPASGRKRVAYYFHQDIGNFAIGSNHPMKPMRIPMVHNLVLAYDLHRKLDMFSPRQAEARELTAYHGREYIEFLRQVTPFNQHQLQFRPQIDKFLGDTGDCPVFDGMLRFCQLYSGGSIGAARKLMESSHDIAINWSGGLHHAKKNEAFGLVGPCVCVCARIFHSSDMCVRCV